MRGGPREEKIQKTSIFQSREKFFADQAAIVLFFKLVSSTTRVFRCVYLMYVSSVHIVTSRGKNDIILTPSGRDFFCC